MRVDPDKSEFHEAPHAREDFTKQELRSARLLLRRLRFLEQQVRETEETDDGSGGAQFAIWESVALEWVLGKDGINFLAEKEPVRS